jgi:hypothetical protein
MIEKLNFKNLRGETWQFNTDTCPLHDFDIETPTEITHRRKMQEHGEWPGFAYGAASVLRIEGDIVRDTTEAYVADRLAINRIIIPPVGRQRTRPWGDLYLRMYGMTEDVTARASCDGFPAMPLHALYPTVGPLMVAFLIFDPYWTGVGSGRRIVP